MNALVLLVQTAHRYRKRWHAALAGNASFLCFFVVFACGFQSHFGGLSNSVALVLEVQERNLLVSVPYHVREGPLDSRRLWCMDRVAMRIPLPSR